MFDLNPSLAPSVQLSQGPLSYNNPAPSYDGTVNLSGGVIYDIFTIPSSFTFTAASNNGGGGGTVSIYIFNNTNMTSLVTDNGSGAGSITNTFGDGYTGGIYQQIQRSANKGKGPKIRGIITQAITTSSGAQIATPYATMQMQVLYANGEGGATPVPINMQEALRNVSNQVGILSVVKGFYLNAVAQIKCQLPVNTTFSFIFITESGVLF